MVGRSPSRRTLVLEPIIVWLHFTTRGRSAALRGRRWLAYSENAPVRCRRSVAVSVAEIPRLVRVDQESTAGVRCIAGGDGAGELLPEPLVPNAVAVCGSSCGMLAKARCHIADRQEGFLLARKKISPRPNPWTDCRCGWRKLQRARARRHELPDLVGGALGVRRVARPRGDQNVNVMVEDP
jgi:hypothetical protein